MNITITKDTTDDELLASLDVERRVIVERITADGRKIDSERLAGWVNDLAELEGRVRARAAYRDALAADADPAAIKMHLMRLLLAPPGDEWSGRKNDCRRAKNDGMRDEVQNLLWKVRG